MGRVVDIFKYAFKECMLQRAVKKCYYGDAAFSHLDRSFIKRYLFRSPYTISKRYLRHKGECSVHTYGETPLPTYEKIAREAYIHSEDIYLELGFGRGRGIFFLHHFFQCRAIGVERIPLFVGLAKQVAIQHNLEDVSFICADFNLMSLPTASVVYLYGTALHEEEIYPLISKLKTLPAGARIVSISYPLTDYEGKAFHVQKCFPVTFLWGETDAYLQTVRG